MVEFVADVPHVVALEPAPTQPVRRAFLQVGPPARYGFRTDRLTVVTQESRKAGATPLVRHYLVAEHDLDGWHGRAWLVEPESRDDVPDTYCARLDLYGEPAGCTCPAGRAKQRCVHADALSALVLAGVLDPVELPAECAA